MDCRPAGSSVHGIFQATALEWVAISFPRGSSQLRDQMRASCIGKRVPLSKGSHCLLEFLKKTCYSDFYVLICDLLFLQKINSNKGREVSGNVTIILG